MKPWEKDWSEETASASKPWEKDWSKTQGSLKDGEEKKGLLETAGDYLLDTPNRIKNQALGALQGATLNYADEIEAGVRSMVTDDDYDTSLIKAREKYKKAQEDNGMSYLAGNLTGATAPASVVSKAIGMTGKGANSLLNSVPTAALVTGGEFSGAAEGEQDRGEEFVKGAAIGGLTVGVGHGVLKVGSKVGSHISNQSKPIIPRNEDEALAFQKLAREAEGIGKDTSKVEDAWDIGNNSLKRLRGDWNKTVRQAPMEDRLDLQNVSTMMRNQHNVPSSDDFKLVEQLTADADLKKRLTSLMAQKKGLYDADIRSQQAVKPDILGNTNSIFGRSPIRYATEFVTPQSWNTVNRAKKGMELSKYADLDLVAKEKDTLSKMAAKATAKAKKDNIEFFKGYDIESPDPSEIRRYVDEVEIPRLEKLGVKPTGEPTEGVGLIGKIYGENGSSPKHILQAALDVAEEQGISSEKVWNLLRHNKKVGDSEFTALVTGKLKDRGQWTVQPSVLFKNQKAHSRQSTFNVLQNRKKETK